MLCLGQGYAKYGAYAIREQLVVNVLARGEPAQRLGTEPVRPSLCPLTRLLGPHCFGNVALSQNSTEPVRPSLYPLTRLLGPHCFGNVALSQNSTEPVRPFLCPLTRLAEPHRFTEMPYYPKKGSHFRLCRVPCAVCRVPCAVCRVPWLVVVAFYPALLPRL